MVVISVASRIFYIYKNKFFRGNATCCPMFANGSTLLKWSLDFFQYPLVVAQRVLDTFWLMIRAYWQASDIYFFQKLPMSSEEVFT
jgi:hypothetical protein